MADSSTLLYRIKEACKSRIQALDQQSDDEPTFTVGQNVYNLFGPDLSNVVFPCWLLSTGDRETEWGGSTEEFYFLLPVLAELGDRETSRHQAREPTYLKWRREVYDAFNNKRLDGVPEVQRCQVEPGMIFDPKATSLQHVVSRLTFRFFVSLPRNTTF